MSFSPRNKNKVRYHLWRATFPLMVMIVATSCQPRETISLSGSEGQAYAVVDPAVKRRIEIFEEVWETINNEYYDSSFNGVNWRAVHDRYRPLVETAANDAEFGRQLEVMMSNLRDSHTRYTPPPTNEQESARSGGSIGVRLKEIEGEIIITSVDPDSDAAHAGVQPGMKLQTVNGKPVAQLFAYMQSEFVGSSSSRSMKELMLHALLYGGFLGTERKLGIVDFDGKQFDVGVTRRAVAPPPPLIARRSALGFGYIKFGEWQPPIGELFNKELKNLMDTPGLIIDLRGNGGGSRDVVLDIASYFFPSAVDCGSNRNRQGIAERYFTHETDLVYRKPLVVLVDEASASASEIFATVMQDHQRARIIGRQTCGCALNQNVRKLKAGGTLLWSYRVYISPKNRIVEGDGVMPDQTVTLSVADIRSVRDAALEAAEKSLRDF